VCELVDSIGMVMFVPEYEGGSDLGLGGYLLIGRRLLAVQYATLHKECVKSLHRG
jgi:hypothetical protein